MSDAIGRQCGRLFDTRMHDPVQAGHGGALTQC
jgi:hypothetical protein